MIRILVLIDYSTEFSRRFLKGLIRYSNVNGPWIYYRLPTYYKSLYGDKNIVDLIKEWKIDAIIDQWEYDETNMLKDLGIPTFIQNYKEEDNYFSTIIGNYAGTGTMAAKFFIQRRFKNFAFYGNRDYMWSREREKGYRCEVEKVGGKYYYFENESVTPGQWNGSNLQLNEWIISLPKPVALFACDDSFALHVSELCIINGINIPKDIALLGVDNDELICSLSYPSISSIVLDAEKGGYETGKLIYSIINDEKNEPFKIVINPTRIELRLSTEKYNIHNDYILDVVLFIEKNFSSDISIESINRLVPLSRRNLEVKFKSEMGTSIYQFILDCRIEYIANMLLITNRSLFDIALEAGFNDLRNAGRIFKKIKGFTPTEYRRRFSDIV